MDLIPQTFRDVFALGESYQGTTEVVARALFIYLAGLVLLRFANGHFLGKRGAFDVILAFAFGSMLSRAINGSSNLVGTLVAAAVLLAVHWVFSLASHRWLWFERLVHGRTTVLVRDGERDEGALRRHHITDKELRGALRREGLEEVAQVHHARLERDGSISVIPRDQQSERPREVKVVEVKVEDGVQTVRLEIR